MGPLGLNADKDPVDQPPNAGTAGGFLFAVPSLNAGSSTEFSRQYTFTGIGCEHKIYGWADRANGVAEGDGNNNLIALPVCVGVTPTPPPACTTDAFEDDYVGGQSLWFCGLDRGRCARKRTLFAPKITAQTMLISSSLPFSAG